MRFRLMFMLRAVPFCILMGLSFGLAAADDTMPNLATGGAGSTTIQQRAQPLDVLPDAGSDADLSSLGQWLDHTRVGYDDGFVIASQAKADLNSRSYPFRLKMNGWGQIRHTVLDSKGANRDLNQFQLKRARLIFAGNAFCSDVQYLVQIDGRSSSGDNLRLLDYYLTYDFGHHLWGLDPGTIGYRAGKYKMPFNLARSVSGREFELADRSIASTFFDVNRSLAWGLFGQIASGPVPLHWETAIFNGLVTGGAETGSSGTLDNNFAYSARLFAFPIGRWGEATLADLSCHETLAARIGTGFAFSTIDRAGSTEFQRVRGVDSGLELADLLPVTVNQYSVALYALDASVKYRGLSVTSEYYLRNISGTDDPAIPDLFDHGFWLQAGYFLVPHKVELTGRWSRVVGNSGTLGAARQSADELAGGLAWYINRQHVKLTADLTHLDGAPINSAALDITPGDIGWLFRTQIQFSF